MWHAWETRKVCKVLVGKPMRKRPFRRPRHRWGKIVIYIRKTGSIKLLIKV
jgi:hypothetical protein